MASKVDIQYHYDVDNEFYALFLDEKYRAYSCAVWKEAQTLEDAQQHKIDRLCRYANVSSGHRIIDVGCGWGGLMNRAIGAFSAASAHGLTLSKDQFEFINGERHPVISVDLCTWQDFLPSGHKYDAIISIGAFEHFASLDDRKRNRQRDVYRNFFEWCQRISTGDAQIGLQTIITARPPVNLNETRDARFLLEKVFPGSALPTISDIQASVLDLYEISAAKRIGLDYARTLEEWKRRLEKNKTRIISCFGAELFDHYNKYFETARRSFQAGIVDLLQVSLRPIKPLRIFL
jgi:cyclopropane-fatty-acyl-phospholipid synthase